VAAETQPAGTALQCLDQVTRRAARSSFNYRNLYVRSGFYSDAKVVFHLHVANTSTEHSTFDVERDSLVFKEVRLRMRSTPSQFVVVDHCFHTIPDFLDHLIECMITMIRNHNTEQARRGY
jgi:phosphoketolase